jgi:ubiquinone biosynthesis protein Coq4
MTPLPSHAPVFKLPEMTKREVIAHEMADKLKQQNKQKKLFSKRMTDRLK